MFTENRKKFGNLNANKLKKTKWGLNKIKRC